MSAIDATAYLESILAPPGNTVPIKTLLSRLDRAPEEAWRYFQRYCKNYTELETFLTDETNSEFFFVENRKVALLDEEVIESRKMAEDFFELKVKKSGQALHYMDLKNQYIGEAAEEVASFIARFYPANQLKSFFSNRPHKFFLLKDNVYLIEKESVKYFKKYIKRFGAGHFTNVRGYIGQAPDHIKKYVNDYCWGNDFRFFLEKHSDVFKVSNAGHVSLLDTF